MALCFESFPIDDHQHAVLREEPDIALPIVQQYYDLGTVDVISVSGCLDRDGEVLALNHSRKVHQSPRRLGVGTMFEPVPEQPFTGAAVDAVRGVLGSGVFELEVLSRKDGTECWTVDLNPRGFGQMTLDMALGNDLPLCWYRSVTGEEVGSAQPRRSAPRFWHAGVTSYIGLGVRLARGPRRAATLARAVDRLVSPSVGAMHEWRDPLPGVRFGLSYFRHPRALIRPFLADTELGESSDLAS